MDHPTFGKIFFRPFGAFAQSQFPAPACAMGCMVSPLGGWGFASAGSTAAVDFFRYGLWIHWVSG